MSRISHHASRPLLIALTIAVALALALSLGQLAAPADAACIYKCAGVRLLTATPGLIVATPTATP